MGNLPGPAGPLGRPRKAEYQVPSAFLRRPCRPRSSRLGRASDDDAGDPVNVAPQSQNTLPGPFSWLATSLSS